MHTEELVPVLFKVLFALIAINCLVNFSLFMTHPRKMYKMLFGYWVSLLGVFVVQGVFQGGTLEVSLAYACTALPVTILAMVAFKSLGERFPLKRYLALYSLSLPATLAIYFSGGGFTQTAAPLSLATAAPLFHSAFLLLWARRSESTRLQKLLGTLYCAIGAHAINFALFRMEPGAQLWGWLAAYACYDVLGILMPSIALEEGSMEEKNRLERLVQERTRELLALNRELENTTKKNETLLKVLLHDISNPLQTIMLVSEMSEQGPMSQRLARAAFGIKSIIQNVRTLYGKHGQSRELLTKEGIMECVEEARFLCEDRLRGKNIELVVEERLSEGASLAAEKTAFTHSVLGNLVTNAIKFSSPGSQIVVGIFDDQGALHVEVKDSGEGMPQEQVERLMQGQNCLSSDGTMGEKGHGMGFSIVKSFMGFFGGSLDITSRPRDTHPECHGTAVRLSFDMAS